MNDINAGELKSDHNLELIIINFLLTFSGLDVLKEETRIKDRLLNEKSGSENLLISTKELLNLIKYANQ